MECDILGELLSKEVLERPRIAQAILERAATVFQGDLDAVEAAVYAAQALDPNGGIPNYIFEMCKTPENAPMLQAFNLMEFIVVNFSATADLLSDKIIDWCLRLLNKAALVDTKMRSLNVAQQVMRNCACMQVQWHVVVSRLREYFTDQKKMTPTVKHALFSFLGDICKLHPDSAQRLSGWLFDQIKITLERCNHEKTVSPTTLLAAAFSGLLGAMHHFTSVHLDVIYKHLDDCCTLRQSGEKNTTSRIAMQVFIEHSAVFKEYLKNDYKKWSLKIRDWISSEQSFEHKQLGVAAYTSFCRTLAAYVKSNPECGKELFLYLNNLDSPPKSFYTSKLALISLVEFAEVYPMITSADELNQASNVLMVCLDSFTENSPQLVGSQLEMLSKVYSIVNGDRSILPKLAVQLVEQFPKIDVAFQSTCLAALEKSLQFWLDSNDVEMSLHLNTVIYQGLLRSSAFLIHADVLLLEGTEMQEKLTSYKNFVPLWEHLLTISSRCKSTADARKNCGQAVYNSFVSNFLTLITKLDLSLVVTGQASDPSAAFEAKKPHDLQIFVNLIDLFIDVIPLSDVVYLMPWLPEISKKFSQYITESPLISGFYKVLAVCFIISESETLRLSVNENFFSSAVLRLDTQKEDLLISNLRMILLAPSYLLETSLHLLKKVVATACRVGRGYSDMLSICIDSLKRWRNDFPANEIQPIIDEGIQGLAPILLNPPGQIKSLTVSEKTAALKTKGKVKKKLIDATETKLMTLQRKFLMMLSTMDSSDVLTFPTTENWRGVALLYRLPMPDGTLAIDLNKLLSRVCELALSCSDRDSRFTACQLLHSFMQLTLGKLQSPTFNELLAFQKLTGVCMTLSCDSDKLIQDVFKPFMLQMVHYFANARNVASAESAALIEILFEGVTHTFDSSLRDFAARCIREYVCWSREQENQRQLSVAKYNIRGIVRKILDFAVHSDAPKRQGAAVAFNSLYDIIRQEKEVLLNYWLRLHYCFTICLEMSHNIEEARVVIVAIDHIHRPFAEKSAVFSGQVSKDSIPPGYGNGTAMDVATVVFKHCQSPNPNLRSTAQKFIEHFVSRTNSTLKDFIAINNISTISSVPENHESAIVAVNFALWLMKNEVWDYDYMKTNKALFGAVVAAPALRECVSEQKFKDIDVLLAYITATDEYDREILKLISKLIFCDKFPLDDSKVQAQLTKLLSSLSQNDEKRSIFIASLPELSEDAFVELLNKREVPSMNSFWQASKLLQKCGMLAHYGENKVLFAIFNLLFRSMGTKVMCAPVERQFLNLLRDVVSYFMLNGMKCTQMAIELITDATPVDAHGKKTTKGEYFFTQFQNELVSHLKSDKNIVCCLIKMKEEGIKWILAIILCSEANQSMATNKFVLEILCNWGSLKNFSRSLIFAILKAISKLKMFENDHRDLEPLRQWFFAVPITENLALSDILDWLELLPMFCGGDDNIGNMRKCFVEIRKRAHFGLEAPSMKPEVSAMQKKIFKMLHLSVCSRYDLTVLKYYLDTIAQDTSLISEAVVVGQVTMKYSTDIKALRLIHGLLYEELVDKKSMFFMKEIYIAFLQQIPQTCLLEYIEEYLPVLHSILTTLGQRVGRDLLKRIAAIDGLLAIYIRTTREDRLSIQDRLAKSDSKYSNLWKKVLEATAVNKMVVVAGDEKETLRLCNCASAKFFTYFVSQLPINRPETFNAFLLNMDCWNAIVDDGKTYQLKMEFKYRPPLKSIKTSFTKPPQENSELNSFKVYANSHSSTLTDSSLSEDIRKFDLTNLLISQEMLRNDIPARELELELDEINKHEVMANYCGLFCCLSEKGGFFWVDSLVSTLKDKDCSRNTKLLILKMLYNLDAEGIIERYKLDEKLAHSILENIVQLFSENNYFVMDLSKMLLRWKSNLAEADENLTKLVIMVTERPGSDRKDVLRDIFELVKEITETWKHLMKFNLLASSLRSSLENNSPKNDEIINHKDLRLCSIYLANNLLELDKDTVVVIVKWIFVVLGQPKNAQLASEVLGQVLAALDQSRYPELIDEVHRALAKKISGTTCLYHICRFYPPILNSFISTVCESACRERSEEKVKSLELILIYVKQNSLLANDDLANAFSIFARDSLKCGLQRAQLAMLNIFVEIVGELDQATISGFVHDFVAFSSHSVADIRMASCKILMKLIPPVAPQIMPYTDQCAAALLRRTNDIEKEIKNACLAFWCNENMPKASKDRLLFIFKEMYSPIAEDDFVMYSLRIFLQAAATLSKFNEDIFDRPLENCDFKEQQLLLSWRVQHSAMPALFVPSLCTELGRLDQDLPIGSSASSLREIAMSLKFSSTLSDSDASFQAPTTSAQSSINRLKKSRPYRFLSSQEAISASFAKKYSQKIESEKASAEDVVKQKDSNVTLHRPIRNGDYPDIQMKHSEFVMLLLALAEKDVQVAKMLFMILFESTSDSVSSTGYWNELSNCLTDIVKKSSGQDPIAVSVFMEMSLKKNITLPSCEIHRLSTSTGLLSLGAVVSENSMEKAKDNADYAPPAAKKPAIIEREMNDEWLQLAQIYHKLNDANAIRGIFLDKLQVGGPAQQAILAEASYDWTNARDNFAQVQSDPANSVHRNHFYTQSLLNCLENLSDWTQISKCVSSCIDAENLLWDDPWCHEVLLPWHVRSKLMTSLPQTDGTNEFVDFVVATTADPQKNKKSLRFVNEFTVAHWLRQDVSKTIMSSYQSLKRFISGWSAANVWDFQLKKTYMQNLHFVCEVQKIVSVSYSKCQNQDLSEMLKENSKQVPNARSNLKIWDMRLTLQKRFCEYLKSSCDVSDFEGSVLDSQLSLAETALHQNNVSLARKYLLVSKNSATQGETHAKWLHIRHSASILEVKNSIADPATKLKEFTNLINKVEATDGESSCFSVLPILSEMIECERQLPISSQNVLNPMTDLKEKWLVSAQKNIEGATSVTQKGNVYVQMAKFYNNNASSNCWVEVVNALLKAMQCGNQEARQLFGGIFTMDGKCQNDDLIKECKKVPTWYFLIWRQQLIAYISGSFDLGRHILLRMAKEYPRALGYPLRLYKEHNTRPNDELIKKLSSLVLNNDIEEAFVKNIGAVVSPFHKARYILEKVENLLKETFIDWPSVKAWLKTLEDMLTGSDHERILNVLADQIRPLARITNSNTLENARAECYKKIVAMENPHQVINQLISLDKFFKERHQVISENINFLQELLNHPLNFDYYSAIRPIKSDLEWHGKGLVTPIVDEGSFTTSFLQLQAAMKKKIVKECKLSSELKRYSPMLAQYHWMADTNYLEIPGQYDGLTEPRPERHVLIASFSKSVIVLPSKRQPIKLTVTGNDGKKYSFLVKYGEDLRQDERIQQVLSQMQNTLRANKSTADVSLEGYSVIPLSSTYGLIQWMDSVESLWQLMDDPKSKAESALTKLNYDTKRKVIEWCSRSVDGVQAACLAYKKRSVELIAKYEENVAKFPADLLRNGFWRLSASPQQFFFLRSNFASSLAAMNIANWILGVGDRHLENIMVSSRTGRAVGIDFGMAFGSATRYILIPELVPFRLTQQILNVFGPMKESGWIKQTMIDCLKAFREDPSILLSMLEVFVLEPCMEWELEAKKHCHKKGSFGSKYIDWNPRQKIKAVAGKLEGENPVMCFEVDLKVGHPGCERLPKQLEIVKGRAGRVRFNSPQYNLTCDRQVDILIDLATDPLILSLIWIGWSPWL